MREIVSSGPVLDGATSPVIRDVLAATAAFLAEGMRQGVIARSDPAHLAMSIIGLHLTWFAASSVSSELTGHEVNTAEAIRRRQAETRVQVRRLCGARSEPSMG